jgi:hypothetical protein
MGFTQASAAIDEHRIEGLARILCDLFSSRGSELIGLAFDKRRKGVLGLQIALAGMDLAGGGIAAGHGAAPSRRNLTGAWRAQGNAAGAHLQADVKAPAAL